MTIWTYLTAPSHLWLGWRHHDGEAWLTGLATVMRVDPLEDPNHVEYLTHGHDGRVTWLAADQIVSVGNERPTSPESLESLETWIKRRREGAPPT